MFTPVLEKSVREFASREGINLYPKWEGCGKLVTRIETSTGTSTFPDAYFACDQMFLDKVKEHFKKPHVISNNEIVIAVRHDLKSQIQHPNDLLAPQIRVGICDPDLSALGKLSQLMLDSDPYQGIYEKLKKKAAVTVDVGPTLISQLLSGGLDAAFVYRSNLHSNDASLQKLSVVELDRKSKYSIATQPWAVSKTTRFPNLMNRLFLWIQNQENKERFETFGFQLIDERP